MFQPQIGLGRGQFIAQRDPLGAGGERCPEQVGEVFDGSRSTLAVGGCQCGHGVQAVEEEVRPDAGLQCGDACPSLGLHLQSPLVGHVGVAQTQSTQQPGQQEVAQDERAQSHARELGVGIEPFAGQAGEADTSPTERVGPE